MANNSSKTAHVMNLLSKNRGSGAAAPEELREEAASLAEAAAQAATAPQAETVPQAATAPQAEAAPIISSITADAAVSSQIKDALEAELKEGSEAAPVQQTAVPQAATASQAATAPQAAAPQAETVPQAAAAAQNPAPAEEPPQAPMDLSDPKPGVSSEDHAFINVMEILVDEKADEYMKMFGICCCDKCRVDVRAYALNRLPPKYVVLSEHERVPRLTVYESRFASDITAQLIKACKQVMLTPHHTRKDD